jgi:hypothetical protein
VHRTRTSAPSTYSAWSVATTPNMRPVPHDHAVTEVTAQPRPSRPPEWEKGGRDGRCSRQGAGAPSLVAGTFNAGGAARYFPAHRRSESSRGAARRARPGGRSDSERIRRQWCRSARLIASRDRVFERRWAGGGDFPGPEQAGADPAVARGDEPPGGFGGGGGHAGGPVTGQDRPGGVRQAASRERMNAFGAAMWSEQIPGTPVAWLNSPGR